MLTGAIGFLAQEHGVQAREAASTAPSPPPELVFYVGPMGVTNTVLSTWVVMVILVLFAYFSTRTMRLQPKGVQNFWEMIIELWVGVTENTMGRPAHGGSCH